MKHLQISSSETTASTLSRSRVPGTVLPWRDCLHEGPVPAGLSLEEMSRMRARFASGYLEGRAYETILARFAERDAVLRTFKGFEEITLWFGHNLHDQLQLLQILHWFARREIGKSRLTLVCIDGHPEIERFTALDQLSAEQCERLHGTRREVSEDELELGKRAWEAFCSERPVELQDLTREDLAPLPFLRGALLRHLEQFPWTRDGLSRTEHQILEAVARGPADLRTMYRFSQIDREEVPFMTHPPFLFHIKSLCGGKPYLVNFVDGAGFSEEDGPPHEEKIWDRALQLTDIGRKILAGQADCIRLYGIDRWLGGVRLQGTHAAWRWDGKRRAIVGLNA